MEQRNSTLDEQTVRRRLLGSIRAKLILSFCVLFVTVLVVVKLVDITGLPFTSFSGRRGQQREEAFKSLSLIADLKKERLLRWIDERRGDARMVSDNEMVRASIAHLQDRVRELVAEGKQGAELWALVRQENSYLESLDFLNNVRYAYGVYDRLSIAGAESGTIFLSTDEVALGADVSQQPFFTGALRTRADHVSDITLDPQSQLPALHVGHAINDSTGEVMAVLVMEVSADDIIKPMLHTGEGLGERGEALLVNQDVRILTSLKHSLADGSIARPLEYQITAQPAVLAAKGEEGIIESGDYRGEPVLAAYRHIRLTSEVGWGLVVKRDQAELYAPLYQDVIYSIVIGLAGVVAVVVLTIVFARNLTSPIQSLSRAASQVAEGNLAVQAPVTTTDEVGALAQTFNAMVQRIRNWREELEEQVQARTVELRATNQELKREIAERKQAEEALQQRTAQIQLLFEAGQRLGQSLDLETIFGAVHDLISQTMTCDGLVVSSYSQEDNLIRCVTMYHEGSPLDVSEFPPIPLEPEGKGTQSIAIRTGESLILADFQQHRRTAQTSYYVDEEGIVNHDQAPADEEITRSALIVPLKSAGRVIGVIQVFSYRVDDFTEDDLALLEALAPQIAAAMTNALLYRQAQREIDERKRAEEELREYREHLEELVETRTVELNEQVAEVEQLNRGMVNLSEDIQASNRNLEMTTMRLQEVNQELADFAYVVSHDLKAPLRAVTQLAGWIATDYADALDTDGQEMVHLLIGRTKRMHNLIEGILQYSRIGRVKEKERNVNLNLVVQGMIEMLAPPDNVQITVADELPIVVGERTRLEQVFQNLLDNSIKFMDKPEGRISVCCADEGTRWLFSVADNGPGIAEMYFDKIFQMFQTLTPRDEFESTGVGLALVKKIVETNDGKVWVESTVGEGSTFYFTLPKTGM